MPTDKRLLLKGYSAQPKERAEWAAQVALRIFFFFVDAVP